MKEKFELMLDLGTIIVPEDYKHHNRLDVFRKKSEKEKTFTFFHDAITDKNFPYPSQILEVGDEIEIKVFKQSNDEITTFEERMTFLESKQSFFPSIQGVSLVLEYKRDFLPKNFCYQAFDMAGRLWKDQERYFRIPSVFCSSENYFQFDLGFLESAFNQNMLFFCFSKPSKTEENISVLESIFWT